MVSKTRIIERLKEDYAKRHKLGKYAKKDTEDYYSTLAIDKETKTMIDIIVDECKKELK